MSIKKFGQNDVFYNVLKTKPHVKFSIYNGNVTYRADFANSVPSGYTALNDLNLDVITPSAPETGCNQLNFSEICNSQYIPLV